MYDSSFIINMKAEHILKLIPAKKLDFLSVNTKVDHQVKKLKGYIIFKLILFSMLNTEKLSLRVMESFLKSAQFRHFLGDEVIESKYNSIRDRISSMNYKYFENIFEYAFKRYNSFLNEYKALTTVDSTFISISSKLISWGMQNGPKDLDLSFLKFTVSLKGSLPSAVQFYSSQDFVNDNVAMKDAILKNTHLKESVVVFDRGLTTRKVFNEFTDKDILFVGRLKTDVRYTLKTQFAKSRKPRNSSVQLIEDIEVYLYNEGKKLPNTFRICKFKIIQSGLLLYLITNTMDLSAYEVAAIYKQRWEIEVFFKFLKQHLNLKHIISRNENAIRVMIYITLILAMMIMVYKKKNNIKGFKIAKLKFEIELDNMLLKEIIKLCGGNPKKADFLWNSG